MLTNVNNSTHFVKWIYQRGPKKFFSRFVQSLFAWGNANFKSCQSQVWP